MSYKDSFGPVATRSRIGSNQDESPTSEFGKPQRTINVQDFINAHKISRYQGLIIVVCFLTIAIDGFDAQAIGFIAPAIKNTWKLGPAQLSPLFGMGLFGLMVGAFIFGPLADKFGRKLIIIIAVISFGLFSFASAYAHSIQSLVVLRFLTGLGLGGAMPNTITITSEYCPQRKRSLLVTVMFCGFTLGGAGGGVLAARMVGAFGWRSVFVLGGIAPLAMGPIIWLCLPESVRYLVVSGKGAEKISRILLRIAPQSDVSNAKFVLGEQPLSGFPVKHLFRKGLLGGTVCLWITFFVNIMVVYFFTSWLPTIIHGTGMSLTRASILSSVYLIGGTAGGISVGFLMDRVNPYRVLIASMLGGGIAIALVGRMTTMPWLTIPCILFAGVGTSGSQIGLNALTAAFYPTASRATGVSWALGIGRCGSVFGSMIGGYLLATHLGLPKVYLTFAGPMLVAAFAIFVCSLTARAHAAALEWKVAAAAAGEMAVAK